MKKIKAFITVIDELDIVKEVSLLINKFINNKEENEIRIPSYLIEYEDDDHLIHYGSDIIIKVFEALNFKRYSDLTNVFVIRNNLFITFKFDKINNEYIIQMLSDLIE